MGLNTDTGTFTSKVDMAMGTAIASAATPNIADATGNTLRITGTTTITGFSAAPQAGVTRTLIFNGAVLLTNSANLVLFGGANITTMADDVAVFVAKTTAIWEMVSFHRSAGYTNGQFDSDAILNGAISSLKIGDAAVIVSKMPTKEVVALSDAPTILTASQLVTKGIFTISPTTSRNLTTDSAVNIIAALPNYQVGTNFEFFIKADNSNNAVLVPGVGVDTTGWFTTMNDSTGVFVCIVTSPTTVLITRKS